MAKDDTTSTELPAALRTLWGLAQGPWHPFGGEIQSREARWGESGLVEPLGVPPVVRSSPVLASRESWENATFPESCWENTDFTDFSDSYYYVLLHDYFLL